MPKLIALPEAQQRLDALVDDVQGENEPNVVERLGVPVAVIMSMEEYARNQRYRAQRQLRELTPALGPEVERLQLTEDQLERELRATRREDLRDTYGE